MEILAHRGFWTSSRGYEKNSNDALKQALEFEFGFESDIRDYCGNLVLSHDMADENSMKADDIFGLLSQENDRFCFAINVKSDGLAELLKQSLEKYQLENYFTFDMSIPQMLHYKRLGLRYFTRQSEFEQIPALYEDAAGVWLDGFLSEDWMSKEVIDGHLKQGKSVCIVSPELHGRNYEVFWETLKDYKLPSDLLYLCTDYPDKAKCFFNE